MSRRSMAVPAGLLLCAALVLAGCSSSSSSAPPTTKPALHGSVTVLAASSLSGSFATIGKAFEKLHPGVNVSFSFGASDTLAAQIVAGAPADVFASASPKTMATVVDAKDAATSTLFASNVLEIATPPSNPASVTSVSSLANPSTKVALCEPLVPCGETARAMLAKNHVSVTPVTLGEDVKAVLTLVELGEVDAGVVYVTDVKSAGSHVHGVTIPTAENVRTDYPIAPLTSSTNATAARAFVAYVLSPAGQAVLKKAGFGAP